MVVQGQLCQIIHGLSTATTADLPMLQIHLHGPVDVPSGAIRSTPIGSLPVTAFPAEAVAPLPPLPVTFDQAASALQSLPQCFFEPDGAFLMRFPPRGPAWCVEGELYDNGRQLHYVTLRLRCDSDAPRQPSTASEPYPFSEFLHCFGWPERRLTAQWVEGGLMARLDDFLPWFRQWSETPAARARLY